jgi:hypothetical protein
VSADTKLLPGTLCRVTLRGSRNCLYRKRWSEPTQLSTDRLHGLEENRLVTLVTGPLRAWCQSTDPGGQRWELYLVTDRGGLGWLRMWDHELKEAPLSLIVPVDP